MGVQEAIRDLVEGCIEEEMDWPQTRAMLPSLIIATGQSDRSSGLLSQPMSLLLDMGKDEFELRDGAIARELDRRSDAIKAEHIVAGGAALGLIGFAAHSIATRSPGKGKPCGDGYISASYSCRKGQVANIPSHLNEFYDLASSGTLIPLTKQEKQRLKPSKDLGKFVAFTKDGDHWFSDTARIKNKRVGAVTQEEALGLSQYLGPAYKGINKFIRTGTPEPFFEGVTGASYSKETISALSKAAANGLHKIKPVGNDFREILSYEANEKKAKKLVLEETPSVLHQMQITDTKQLAALLGEIKTLQSSGENLVMNKFLSTTFYKDGSPGIKLPKLNLEFSIKPKLDGSGAGRLADPLKSHVFEAELLYPPMTQFKITGVRERLSPKTQRTIHVIDMEED